MKRCGSGEDLWAGPGGQPAQHIGHVPEPAPILTKLDAPRGERAFFLCLPSVLVLCCVPCLCLLVRPFPPPIRKKMCGGEATNPSVNVKVPCEARNQTDPPMGGSATCPPP